MGGEEIDAAGGEGGALAGIVWLSSLAWDCGEWLEALGLHSADGGELLEALRFVRLEVASVSDNEISPGGEAELL